MALLSQPIMAAADTPLPGYTEGAKVIEVPVTGGQIDTLNGIIYAQVNQLRSVRQLRMDLLVPRNADRKPTIVYFPGGGFTSADYGKFIEMRMALAKAGFVVASAEYRVVPDKFPAPVEDGKAAVRYLRAHAKDYGIDPARIGVLGDSAGGYLAQMLGTTNGEKKFDTGDFLDQSSDVQAAATLYGISDLRNIGEGFPEAVREVHASPAVTEALLLHGPAFRDFPGATIQSDPTEALAASPMGHIAGHEPPFLIMHGSADTLVSPRQSAQLYESLRKGGTPADYDLVDGAGHGDIHWFQAPVIDRVTAWFRQTLGAPLKGDAQPVNGKAQL
ncbi:alpha/beta hydrolase [Azospirillum sp. YIM B02556]|uniref:Alpha/beta hydrolase n=1 Tax=Azospirillum endophyticum TaxID=2800326 RepID=A0ABS1F358_9PROT|nr:alpha/beta hydrolase [Azospirillum endophyticum]MBK1837845.1 alpha/beta hydrolase [Azospirillum endophyticum]